MKLAPFFICEYKKIKKRVDELFLGLTEVAKGANYSKCPLIDIDANEKWKGPKCDADNCVRRCEDGFTPAEPTTVQFLPETHFHRLLGNFQVFCFKKNNGSFKWIDENGENAVLGPCVAGEATTVAPTEAPTCKPIELKGSQTKSGMEVNCKVNSSEFVRFLKHFTLTRFYFLF